MLKDVFNNYVEIYKHILLTNQFYPSVGSTGFQERNLSVNFSKAYDKTYDKDNILSWFEFQFGKDNNKHFDCLIINVSKKEIYIIESKRYTDASSKDASIDEDIERIVSFVEKGLDNRFKKYKDFKVYGLILADVWTENDAKLAIYNSYFDKTHFFDHPFISNDEQEYCTYLFQKDTIDCKSDYALLSYLWTI